MTRREPRWPATHREANSYFGDAAAAGAAIAGDGADIAEGASLPAWACIDDFVAAFAAAFACRLQRYTLEVETLRSVATSLAFLPLLSSFITASQSTLVEANAGRAASATVVRSIAEAAARANFLINIFFPRIEFRFVSNDAQYSKIHGSSKGVQNRFPVGLGMWIT